jgi:hypothetical protein
MRRNSFLGQVLTAVARSTPARSVASDTSTARPASQLLMAIARTTPAFTPGNPPALNTRLREGQRPDPASSAPNAVTDARGTDDVVEFGPWVPSTPRRGSYRQALVVAVAALAVPVIVAAIVLIKTATDTTFGSIRTVPVPLAGNTSANPPSPAISATRPPSVPPPSMVSPSGTPGVNSAYDTLLTKVPGTIRGNCSNAGTQFGAIAVSQCNRLNLAAGTIQYYLYPSAAALASGVSQLLSSAHFRKQRECTTGSDFTDFLVECQSDFHNQTPFMTGTIAEYISKDNAPLIVTTDKQQNVMAILVGTNAGDLLSYWKQLEWVVS